MTDKTQDVVEAILSWLRSDHAKGSDDWCDAADAFADHIEENILPRFTLASLSASPDGFDILAAAGRHLNQIDDALRQFDDRGAPFMSYSGQHVVDAFKAGAALRAREASK